MVAVASIILHNPLTHDTKKVVTATEDNKRFACELLAQGYQVASAQVAEKYVPVDYRPVRGNRVLRIIK